MKLLKTELRPVLKESIQIETRDQNFLCSPFHLHPSFHSHPEFELVYIVEGYGKRIIGNQNENFEPGDMVFIGSNVPHIWLSDPIFYDENSTLKSKVIVTYFNPDLFVNFQHIKELKDIAEMLNKASRGYKIFGKTKELINKKLLKLEPLHGFKKVEGMLQIMNILAKSDEKSFIINFDTFEETKDVSDRLIDILVFIKKNIQSKIYLKDVANMAHMTEESFCRYFKGRMKKSFLQYVNDLKLDYAKELLIKTDKSISEIAYSCGYNSPSHFCSIFKKAFNKSPKKYRIVDL